MQRYLGLERWEEFEDAGSGVGDSIWVKGKRQETVGYVWETCSLPACFGF